MIDVMFFLLATFMLASLTMRQLDSVKVDLPRGAAAAPGAEDAGDPDGDAGQPPVPGQDDRSPWTAWQPTLKTMLDAADPSLIVAADQRVDQRHHRCRP
jgi:biopolymer transport protein ExbD